MNLDELLEEWDDSLGAPSFCDAEELIDALRQENLKLMEEIITLLI